MNRTLAALLVLAATPAAAQDGVAAYDAVCAACHGAAGVGTPGLAPPLAGTDTWTTLGDRAPEYFAGVMAAGLTGRIAVNGQDYIGLAMPPQGHVEAAELAAIGTYVLVTLNGLPAGPDAAAIEAAVAKPPSHKALRDMRKGQ